MEKKKTLLLSHNGEKVLRCDGAKLGEIITHRERTFRLIALLPIFDGVSYFAIEEI